MSVSLSCGLKVSEIYQISTLARKANTLQYVCMSILFCCFYAIYYCFGSTVQSYILFSICAREEVFPSSFAGKKIPFQPRFSLKKLRFLLELTIITFQTAWYACEYLMSKENAMSN